MKRARGRRGLALIATAGILALLAIFGAAWTRMAISLRERGGLSLDRAQARLLAVSGLQYAHARLAQQCSPALPATAGNQSDDWTCRDGMETPIEKAGNPSYAQTEPYRDIYPALGSAGSPGDGKYEPGLDTYADLNANGRFDSWSGRLRGNGGLASAIFLLKISGQGGEGGINVNSGYLGAGDDNQNGIPDYRDLGERAAQTRKISPPIAPPPAVAGPYKSLPSTVSTPGLAWAGSDSWSLNRRTAFLLNQLGLLAGALTPRVGDRIIQSRPAGGYREVEELAALFPPADWDRLRPHLTTRSRLNRCDTDPKTWQLRGQYLLNPAAAAPEAVAALWCGMGEYRSNRSGAMVNGNDATVQQEYAGDGITAAEALRVARFIQGRPFTSWHELFTALVKDSRTLFVPVPAPSTVVGDGQGGYAVSADDPAGRFGDRRDAERIVLNKVLLTHAIALPADLLWIHYYDTNSGVMDNYTFAFGYSTGNYVPVAECRDWVSYETTHRKTRYECVNEEVSARGPAASLGAGPAAIQSVESLGRVSKGRARMDATANAVGTLVRGRIIAQSQDDFENNHAKGTRFEAGLLQGRPIRDRAASYPTFCLDGTTEGAAFPYTPACGEVRLMDWCWVDPAAIFYLPVWDIHQPERPASLPAAQSMHDASREAARGADWIPNGWSSLWIITPAHDPPGTYECEWDDHPTANAHDNQGPFALFRGESGGDPAPMFREGTIEGWYQEDSYFLLGLWSSNSQTGGCAAGWSQPGTTSWSNPIPPVPGIRYHVAYVFESSGGDGRFTAYVDGIWRGGDDFTPIPWNGHFAMYIKADEFRIRTDPVPGKQMIARALRGRFWSSDSGVPSFMSALYRFDGPAKLIGARWDGFIPKEIRDAAAEQAGAGPDAPTPLRVELLVFDNPADKTPSRRIPLSEDGRWIAFQGDLPLARYLRYQVWLDGIVDGQIKKTPVFERVEIGFNARTDTSVREW